MNQLINISLKTSHEIHQTHAEFRLRFPASPLNVRHEDTDEKLVNCRRLMLVEFEIEASE